MQKIFLGLMPSIGQIEGITIAEDGIYLSGEAIEIHGFSHKQVLYYIPKNIIPF